MLLIQEPELLMLDEPVAGMTISERTKTADLLNRITQNRSVIVIEHDMKFVKSIAHRVTVLHQGESSRKAVSKSAERSESDRNLPGSLKESFHVQCKCAVFLLWPKQSSS